MNKFMLSSVAIVAISTASVAADLPSHKAPAAYPAATSATSAKWTGFYVGLNGGYGNATFKDPYVTPVLGTFSSTGGLAGLQVGFNYQIDKYVIGVEADYDWANLSASKGAAAGASMVMSSQQQPPSKLRKSLLVRSVVAWATLLTTRSFM